MYRRRQSGWIEDVNRSRQIRHSVSTTTEAR